MQHTSCISIHISSTFPIHYLVAIYMYHCISNASWLHTYRFPDFHICHIYLSLFQCLSWDHYPYSYSSIWIKAHICQILVRTLCNTWYHYMSHIWAIYFHNTLLCIHAIQLQIITYKHLSIVTHCLYLELYPQIGAKNHHPSLHFHHYSP